MNTVQYTYDILLNRTFATYIILFTNVTSINLIKKKRLQLKPSPPSTITVIFSHKNHQPFLFPWNFCKISNEYFASDFVTVFHFFSEWTKFCLYETTRHRKTADISVVWYHSSLPHFFFWVSALEIQWCHHVTATQIPGNLLHSHQTGKGQVDG